MVSKQATDLLARAQEAAQECRYFRALRLTLQALSTDPENPKLQAAANAAYLQFSYPTIAVPYRQRVDAAWASFEAYFQTLSVPPPRRDVDIYADFVAPGRYAPSFHSGSYMTSTHTGPYSPDEGPKLSAIAAATAEIFGPVMFAPNLDVYLIGPELVINFHADLYEYELFAYFYLRSRLPASLAGKVRVEVGVPIPEKFGSSKFPVASIYPTPELPVCYEFSPGECRIYDNLPDSAETHRAMRHYLQRFTGDLPLFRYPPRYRVVSVEGMPSVRALSYLQTPGLHNLYLNPHDVPTWFGHISHSPLQVRQILFPANLEEPAHRPESYLRDWEVMWDSSPRSGSYVGSISYGLTSCLPLTTRPFIEDDEIDRFFALGIAPLTVKVHPRQLDWGRGPWPEDLIRVAWEQVNDYPEIVTPFARGISQKGALLYVLAWDDFDLVRRDSRPAFTPYEERVIRVSPAEFEDTQEPNQRLSDNLGAARSIHLLGSGSAVFLL